MKLFISLLSACLLAGCSLLNPIRSSQAPSPAPEQRSLSADPIREAEIGAKYRGMSNKTMRFVSRQELFRRGCSAQAESYNDQRKIASFAAPVVLVQNPVTGSMESVSLGNEHQSVVYDSKTPPFDMTGCLAQAGQTGWERIANKFIGELFGTVNKAIPVAGGVLVAREAADFLTNRDRIQAEQNQATLDALATASENAAPRVEGDNNRVVVGNENTFNEAGGIPTEPLTFSEASLTPGVDGDMPIGELPSEIPTTNELCIGEGFDFIVEDGRCSNGSGGTVIFFDDGSFSVI